MSGRAQTKRAKRSGKRVKGYDRDRPRRKVKLVTEEYEYELPFNYANVTVNRHFYHGSEFHGVEMNPVNSISGRDSEELCGDSIVIDETYPIVRVVVIGSACTPPGYVQIECEPVEGWRRPEELETIMPVRMRQDGLWGMHLRFDQWVTYKHDVIPGGPTTEPYEQIPEAMKDMFASCDADGIDTRNLRRLKSHYREWPLVGMSSAIFETPPSKKVIIMGGSAIPGWQSDLAPSDAHYSLRIIRTTVKT